MAKPVEQRVAEKIATLFDDEERGYLWLSLTQGQEKQAAAQPQQPVTLYNEEIFNDSWKLAHENPGALLDAYEKVANALSPEAVQAIEQMAEADGQRLQKNAADIQKQAFWQGWTQYEGFKAAAAQDEANQQQTKTASTLGRQAPALARAMQGR